MSKTINYLLVKLDSNYADEFDVEAFWVTTHEEYLAWRDKLAKCTINDSREIYFGTNEFVTFNSYKDIITSLTIHAISEETYKALLKIFGNSFGLIDLETLPEYYGYEEDELDEG